MRLRVLSLFALLLACCGSPGGPPVRPDPGLAPGPRAFRERFLAELDGLELELLYQLDPNEHSSSKDAPEAAFFRGYRAVREATPAAEDRRHGRAHRGLRNIMEATTSVGTACFEPGHGARFRGARGTYDVLVCFACNNYRVFGQTRDEVVADAFEAPDAAPWRSAFQSAGLGPRTSPPSR